MRKASSQKDNQEKSTNHFVHSKTTPAEASLTFDKKYMTCTKLPSPPYYQMFLGTFVSLLFNIHSRGYNGKSPANSY